MASAFVDTNILIETDFSFDDYDKVYISGITLEELDSLKTDKDKQRSFKARKSIKYIYNNIEKVKIITNYSASIPFVDKKNDNFIISAAKVVQTTDEDCLFFANDIGLIIKGLQVGINFKMYEVCSKTLTYDGYKVVKMSDLDLASFYEHPENKWGLVENEYIIFINDKGEVVDKKKFTKNGFKALKYKVINSRHVGKIKPRNLQQELYTDMLQSGDCRLLACYGGYGTGKDFLALANFTEMVEKGDFQKIVWIRNNIEVSGSKPIGHLPGSLIEKLAPYAEIVSDFVGGSVGFENLIREGKLELVHTGFIRGRSFTNSIIYCTEAQNMTKEMIQLLISRVGEKSIIFFNGDIKQTDDKCLEYNNGLEQLINTYKGHKNFQCVKLLKCERDEIAEMASLLE